MSNLWLIRTGAALLCITLSSGGMAEDADGDRYFERGEEGWFWYAPEPETPAQPKTVPEAEAAPPPPPVVDAPPAPPAPEPFVATTPDETEEAPPEPLSAAWFRANLDRYRDQAIDDPSPENIEAYLYLQRIALERASAFAEASAAAAVKDPWLDANSERPIATYAAQAIDAQAEAARNTVLEELAKETGILFFYQDGCPLCDSQAGVLKLANDVHGFEIIAVSLDGSPPKGGLESHREDDGQAARLGVAAVPATFLVRPPDQIVPLAQAPLDLQTLRRRIIGQAHALDLIPEETYLATKAVRQPFTLPSDLGDLPPEVMADPERLVDHIKQRINTNPARAEP